MPTEKVYAAQKNHESGCCDVCPHLLGNKHNVPLCLAGTLDLGLNWGHQTLSSGRLACAFEFGTGLAACLVGGPSPCGE